MTGVLADVNIEGHVDYLMALVRAAPWKDLWDELDLVYATFGEVGLSAQATDAEIWQRCQDLGYVLITSNRNRDRPDSLEATIRERNAEDSLPVLTIANAERLRASHSYAQRVAESLVDVLIRIETVRGAGRLYLP
ncbi:MAG TPA: hypothetical protein VJ783_27150 [Pirellulales bacterium]|nr:hypothetical protein [Pirellulales bacterium]